MYRPSAKFVTDFLEDTEFSTATVPRRSLHEPSPPCPLFGSTTTDLASGSEAESADLLSRSPNFYYWKTGVPPIRGVSLAPCSLVSRPVTPIYGASVQEPLSESPDVELSISFKFSFVHSPQSHK